MRALVRLFILPALAIATVAAQSARDLSRPAAIPSDRSQKDTAELAVLGLRPDSLSISGSVITLSFDRAMVELPVGGKPSRDAASLVRVVPALPMRVTWRDPVTIRITPTTALHPGARYTITIDTTVRALDGSRLSTRFERTLRVRGGGWVAVFPLAGERVLRPNGEIELLSYRDVDSASVAREVRLVVRDSLGCATTSIPYRLAERRPLDSEQEYRERFGRYEHRFDEIRTLATVWRLVPAQRPPEQCAASLFLPSLDETDRAHVVLDVRTAGRFTYASGIDGQLVTRPYIRPAGEGEPAVVLPFTSLVHDSTFRRFVHIEPASLVDLSSARLTDRLWSVPLRAAHGDSIRIRLESALIDQYGRRFGGALDVSMRVPDRRPRLGYDREMLILPPSGAATIRLRRVNVDTLRVHVVAVGDSVVTASFQQQRPTTPSSSSPSDQITALVALPTIPLNHEDTVAVTLPAEIDWRDGRLRFIRVEPHATRGDGNQRNYVSIVPDTVAPERTRRMQTTSRDEPQLLKPIVVRGHTSEGTLTRLDHPWVAVQRSDLQVHGFASGGPSAAVVRHRDSNAGIAGVEVRLVDRRGAVLAGGTTDESGVVMLEPSTPLSPREWSEYWFSLRERGSLLIARHGDDRLIVPILGDWYGNSHRLPSLETLLSSDADRGRWWEDDLVPWRGIVWNDRGMYRPGERVFLGAALTEGPANRQRAVTDSIRLTVHDSPTAPPEDARPRGDVEEPSPLLQVVHVPTRSGTITDSVLIPANAPLGHRRVTTEVFRLGKWRPVASGGFRVEQYRVPEFLLAITSDSNRTVYDTVDVRTTGRMLFGAPMVGGRVTWRVSLAEPASITSHLRGVPAGFEVADPARQMRARASALPSRSDSGRLDLTGAMKVAVHHPRPVAATPALVTFHATGRDHNRQEVSTSHTRLLHSSSLYLALAARRNAARDDSSFAMALVAIDHDGRRVAGRRVALAAIRWRRDAWVENPVWTADTVWRDTVTTGSEESRVQVPRPMLDMMSLLEISATTSDRQGRLVRSGQIRWRWDEYVTRSRGPAALALPLQLVRPEASRAAVGDTVALLFHSPWHQAEAWITVLREGIETQRIIVVDSGSVRVPLPVTESWIPDATVSVMLFRRGRVAFGDRAQESMRVGYVTLSPSRERRELRVALELERARHGPAERFATRIRVRDADGRPVRGVVSVWAADEGLLALTNYPTPNPLNAFYERNVPPLPLLSTSLWMPAGSLDFLTRYRGWGVERALLSAMTTAAHEQLVVGPPGEAFARLREDLRSTAFYVGDVTLDASGEARVARKLPENLTTFRLMAVAVTPDGRAGSADTTFTVSKPLLVRASLPRFLRPGDSLDAGGVVSLRHLAARTVTVSARAERSITLLGDPMRRVRANSAGIEVRFPWEAPTSARERDSARIAIAVTDGVRQDAMALTIPYRSVGKPSTRTVAGMVDVQRTITLAFPAGTDLARSSVMVRTGNTPLPFIRVAARYVQGYPYECSEQLASRVRVLVSVLRLERAGTKSGLDTNVVRSAIAAAVDGLSRRQRHDGSFSYWLHDAWRPAWLVSYVGHALLDADAAGIRVAGETIDALHRHVSSHQPAFDYDTLHGSRAQRAARRAETLGTALTLASFARRLGQPKVDAERRLLAQADGLLWEDVVALAELLHRAGQQAEAGHLLDRAWSRVETAGGLVDVPTDERPWLLVSPLRPAARLLSATRLIDPKHERLGMLVERIVSNTRSRRATEWNTHDFGWSVPAIADFVAETAKGAQVADTTYAASSLRRIASRQDDSVRVLVPLVGTGRRYYAVSAVATPVARPVTPERRGIVIERWFERFTDGTPITEVKEGELVRVRLRVTATAGREFVALEDALPAGLEVVDLSLATNSVDTALDSLARAADARGRAENDSSDDDDRWWTFGSHEDGWWTPWEHREIRDDQVRWFARRLWAGSHVLSYVARATTAGKFVLPPAHAEEMYNPGLNGRSQGGTFRVLRQPSR